MEALKEVIAWALSPFIIGIAIQSSGWLFLIRRRIRPGLILSAIGFFILLTGSLPALAYQQNRARTLEHPPIDLSSDLDDQSPVLIVVLGGGFNPDEWLAPMAEILELNPARLEVMTQAESTADEARLTAEVADRNEQIVVVTSAGHMPRALLTFASHDLAPIAAPADFPYPRAESPANQPWKQWIPSSGGLYSTKQWLYEKTAMLWYRPGSS